MTQTSLFKLLVLCAFMALPLHAEEEPPPQADDGASQEGDECGSDEDCPDGYICSWGMYEDSAGPHEDTETETEDSDSEEDTPPEEDDGDSSGSSDGEGVSSGVCVIDPSCDANDECASDEYCALYQFLDCDENEDGTYVCSSAEFGWCEYDSRDSCALSEECDFNELCYQRPIDDEAYCTNSEEVPCSEDIDCGDRLECQDTLIDEMCFWDESSTDVQCETLVEERCGMRPCGHSEECLADEICLRQPQQHPDSVPVEVGSGDDEEGNTADDGDDPQETDMPADEGMCVPPEEGSECSSDTDCDDYEECAALTNLPCFEGDTRCEDASINVCAHVRMECDVDADCPSEHHCSFHYMVRDPFDPNPGQPIDGMGDTGSGSSSDNDGSSDDGDDNGENENGNGGGEAPEPGEYNGPPPMDVGLCFPEYEDMLICDDEGCMLYMDQSYWAENGGGIDVDEPTDGDDDTGDPGNNGGDDDDDTDNDDTSADESSEDDQNLDAASAENPSSLFNCQSTGPEGMLSLLALLVFYRRRRKVEI